MDTESKLIKLIKELSPQSAKFLGDDCATVNFDAGDFVFSLDNFTSGSHYDPRVFSPEDIGWKALAVNLSDIAAMAAKPLYFLVGLALAPNDANETWIKGFYTGLHACAKEHGGAKLIGGDISKATQTTISIAIIGSTNYPASFLRSNAQPGDKICVTGLFGNSNNFLHKYKDFLLAPGHVSTETFLKKQWASKEANDIAYHLRPTSRLKLAQGLAKVNDRAALMDTSDGLVQALFAIADASGVNMEISPGLIPKDKHVNLHSALFGGEDYELLACCTKVPRGFTQIGMVTKRSKTPTIRNLTTDTNFDRSDIYQHFT